MYSDPIRAAGGQSVGEGVAILREPTAREGDSAVFRQRVGVQEYAGFSVQTVLYV